MSALSFASVFKTMTDAYDIPNDDYQAEDS